MTRQSGFGIKNCCPRWISPVPPVLRKGEVRLFPSWFYSSSDAWPGVNLSYHFPSQYISTRLSKIERESHAKLFKSVWAFTSMVLGDHLSPFAMSSGSRLTMVSPSAVSCPSFGSWNDGSLFKVHRFSRLNQAVLLVIWCAGISSMASSLPRRHADPFAYIFFSKFAQKKKG